MSTPTKYTRSYSFSGYQATNPSQPLPAPQVDNELENIEQSLGEAIDAVNDVRRADGALVNEIVTLDSLAPEVRDQIGEGATASAAAAAASADAAASSADASASSAAAAANSATAAQTSANSAATARNAAQNARDDAIVMKNGADTARDFAAQWASAPENTPVDDGVNPVGKSAYHWAKAAEATAGGAIPDGAVTEPKLDAGVVVKLNGAAQTVNDLSDLGNLTLAAGNLDLIKRRSVPDLASDSIISYSATAGKTAVVVGQTVTAGRYQYSVAASGATDHDLTTAGGVKLYVDADTMTPFAFGAVANGNGTGGGTNDAAALQKMLDAAGARNADVKLARGAVYRCDATLTIPAGVRIDGNGATLDFKNLGNATGLSFVDGGSIVKAKVLGAGNSAIDVAGKAITCSGTNNAPSAPTFVTAPDVRDCEISGWSGYGVFFAYTNGGKVTGNKVTNIGYGGIAGVSCNDLVVDANLVDGVTPGSSGGDAYGIFVDRNNGTSETSDPRSYRVGIINNVVKNVASSAGNNGQGIDTHAGVDFRIVGNTVRDCEVGIFVTASVIDGVVKLGPKNCVVSGNTVKSKYYVGYGIMVSGAYDGSLVQDYAEGVVVTGNTVEGHGIAGDATSGAIIAQFSKGLVIGGNSILRPRCNGVHLATRNLGFNVSGNSVLDPFDVTYTEPACIHVYGSDNRGYIGDNTLRFEDGTLATYVAVRSIRINSGISGLDLEIGRHSLPGVASGRLSYAENTSTGVNAANMMVQRGTLTVPLTDAASATVAVTTKRFPVDAPHVQLTRSGGPLPGTVTKAPLIEVSPTSLTATGFNVVARPYDGTTFGGSGNITVEWTATV